MDTQQKAEALNALSPVSISLDVRNRWVATNSTQLLDGKFLEGICGRADTPGEAIEQLWQQTVVNLKTSQRVVLNATSPNTRQEVRWNGFMWANEKN